MSRRKRYRKLRNKAVRDNTKLFAQNRQKHREEREASSAHEQLGRARLLYERFKSELASAARTPPQIIADFEAFKDAIRKVVKHAHARKVILDEISWAQTKFLAAYGPKTEAQKAQWRAEAKALRVSNRKPSEEPDPSRN